MLPEDGPDARAHILDLIMLTITGGRERSASQFSALLDAAGFRLSTVVETAGPMRIVEGVAV